MTELAVPVIVPASRNIPAAFAVASIAWVPACAAQALHSRVINSLSAIKAAVG